MRSRFSPPLIAVLVFFVGCDSWPPYHDEATENFEENQDSFVALEAKLLASDYSSVYTATGTDAIGVVDGDGGPIRQLIEDDPEWAELFRKTQVSRIRRYQHKIVFVPPAPHSENGRDTEISYTHFLGVPSELIECEPKFDELDCGVCGVRLTEDWWIDYMWYPMPILEAESQMYLDGTLAEEEYFAMQGAAYAECQVEGLEAIGYERE